MDAKFGNQSLLTEIGSALLGQGWFAPAAFVLKKAVKSDPGNIKAHKLLSSVLHILGDLEGAREVLVRGVSNTPYFVRPCSGEPLLTILRFMGVQNAFYTIGEKQGGQDRYAPKLSHGNFADTYLTDPDRFTVFDFLVLEGNILDFEGLPEHDLVINSIADPDFERDSLLALSEYLKTVPHMPAINHPDRVLPTTRDLNYQRFKDFDGLVFPKTLRLGLRGLDDEQAVGLIEEQGTGYPLLIRETGTHTGKTFAKIDDPKTLCDTIAEGDYGEIYLIEYVENLKKGKYFWKMRVFLIDGNIYPVVLHIDEFWNVHGGNRKEVMKDNAWMTDEETAFVSDCEAYLGPERYETLRSLYDVVGLDFFGIDFSILENGNILIYELNPAMRHSFHHARNFPYLTPYYKEIAAAFNRMILDKSQRAHPGQTAPSDNLA
ncbi:MAG TPA: hypothetical protein ENI72_00495 [Rhodospirillales bacterium]|nr:hypothetical protein [Rhodospirillales bacterium]